MAATSNHHDELPRLASTSPTECCACNCEPFNDNESVPRVLSECGHTVCDPCLRQLAKPTSDGKLEAKCPSCPTTTKLGGVDSFPTNHILLGHIQSVQPKPSTKPKCEGCAEPAEFGCDTCKIKLCSDCWPRVHFIGALLDHVKGSLSDAEQPPQCSRHPKKEMDFMCVDASCPDKDELICYLCKETPPHDGHQTKVLVQGLVDRVFEDKRHELSAAIDRMHDSIAFAARVLAHVNSTQQSTTTNRDTAIHHIEEHFEQLIEQLRARKVELIGQVNALVGRKSEKLEAQRREVTGHLEQSYSAVHAGIDGMQVTNQRQFSSSCSLDWDARPSILPTTTAGLPCSWQPGADMFRRSRRLLDWEARPSILSTTAGLPCIKLPGTTIDTPSNDGKTPMYLAAILNRRGVSAIELLVRFGSNAIDTPDNNDWTPLLLAMTDNSYIWTPKAAQTLIWLGANRNIRTNRLTTEQREVLDAPMDEDAAADLRFRVYFSRSLVARLLLELDIGQTCPAQRRIADQ